MAIDSKVTEWRKAGKHLPKFMRDFHDQKDLIKAMHYYTRVDEITEVKDINTQNGHIYVIDVFLWFMARHGYTLQKTQSKLPFENIEDTIENHNQIKSEFFAQMLQQKK